MPRECMHKDCLKDAEYEITSTYKDGEKRWITWACREHITNGINELQVHVKDIDVHRINNT